MWFRRSKDVTDPNKYLKIAHAVHKCKITHNQERDKKKKNQQNQTKPKTNPTRFSGLKLFVSMKNKTYGSPADSLLCSCVSKPIRTHMVSGERDGE